MTMWGSRNDRESPARNVCCWFGELMIPTCIGIHPMAGHATLQLAVMTIPMKLGRPADSFPGRIQQYRQIMVEW
jgi:hypothetical protein